MTVGFETRRADGSVNISTRDGIARLIYSEFFDHDFNGTRHVPAFDDERGVIQILLSTFKIANTPAGPGTTFTPRTRVPDATPIGGFPSVQPRLSNFSSLPSLHWSNADKILTLTPASSWDPYFHTSARADYVVQMVHYR
jgi:hypothetical protein